MEGNRVREVVLHTRLRLNKVLRLSITKSDSIRRGMRVSHVAACSLQKHTVTGNAVRLMRLVLLVRLETMGFYLYRCLNNSLEVKPSTLTCSCRVLL